MTTYNQLAGYRVNYLGSDPTLNTGNEGQVWYNSTSGTLKSLVQLKAWSAAGSLPVAKNEAGSDGTSTAGWIAGGSNTPAGNTGTTTTDEYSGYTWASGGNLNTARVQIGGTGTQTAAVAFGGAGPTQPQNLANSELYDGTSWTTTASLGTARRQTSKGGSQGPSSAGLAVGGLTPARSTATEEYNVETTAANVKTITTS